MIKSTEKRFIQAIKIAHKNNPAKYAKPYTSAASIHNYTTNNKAAIDP